MYEQTSAVSPTDIESLCGPLLSKDYPKLKEYPKLNGNSDLLELYSAISQLELLLDSPNFLKRAHGCMIALSLSYGLFFSTISSFFTFSFFS